MMIFAVDPKWWQPRPSLWELAAATARVTVLDQFSVLGDLQALKEAPRGRVLGTAFEVVSGAFEATEL